MTLLLIDQRVDEGGTGIEWKSSVRRVRELKRFEGIVLNLFDLNDNRGDVKRDINEGNWQIKRRKGDF